LKEEKKSYKKNNNKANIQKNCKVFFKKKQTVTIPLLFCPDDGVVRNAPNTKIQSTPRSTAKLRGTTLHLKSYLSVTKTT